ncbi:hypothetical protein OE88DRAFT_1662845 [Heliocybe sulcata]|uniref:F-box domain-containing protein n=1 Tax=Heliocybe sulcata TaxID=5364 RepID=A0A5C3MWJ5_9AGAM|nr:hypothetical protein OE88DRAFT_1662845 [Heliocybe sulcata]
MSQLKSISLCVPVPDMHERSSWVVLHNLESVTFRRSPVDCVTAVLKRLFGVYSTAHTLAFMQPLLKCHEIAKFDFRQIYVTTERDDEVEAFAEAWPRIEELLLCAPVNPRSVIVLAVKCPNLRRLQFLDINLATVPSLESIAHIRPHGLERLHTEHVSAVDLESSARFLERLFPSIAKVFYGNEDGAVELYPFLLRMMRDREDAEFLLESAQADVYLEEDSE